MDNEVGGGGLCIDENVVPCTCTVQFFFITSDLLIFAYCLQY